MIKDPLMMNDPFSILLTNTAGGGYQVQVSEGQLPKHNRHLHLYRVAQKECNDFDR